MAWCTNSLSAVFPIRFKSATTLQPFRTVHIRKSLFARQFLGYTSMLIRPTYTVVLRSALMFVSLVGSQAAGVPTAESKPNILIIYADDLGYGDVRCYNPERGKIATPHIDKLAAQGMRFTDGHSSSGVCSPSRYTLLTGRYHWRTRLQSGIVNLWGEPLIAPQRMTIGTLAKQQGYRTACIGKWHLGWDWPIAQDRAELFKEKPKGEARASDAQREVWREVFSQPVAGGPVSRGFDCYFGTDVPNWPPFCFIENDRTVGIPSEFLSTQLLGNNLASLQGPGLVDWTLEPILPMLADRAVEFIKDSAQKGQPFLLYLPLTSPHTPLAVNEPWKGKSGLNAYADLVMETDDVVGRVVDALEASGSAGKTLVIFTSDNGCAPYIGMSELEALGHFPSGPLRGAKADAWEGGHRVPFIVRWPGVVKDGVACDQLVHQSDLLRTLAEVVGATLPENAGEDSFSMLSLFKGSDEPIREHAVSTSISGIPALRAGSWKYIAAPGSGGWGKGGDSSQPVQIYDLSKDIGESKNLALDLPEKVVEMQSLLERLIVNGRSTPGTAQSNDVQVKSYPTKPSTSPEK
jgi:arylsulfatase A